MAYKLTQHLIAATLALIVFLTTLPFIDSIRGYVRDDSPAIEWYSVRVLTPVVRPGEKLEFEYTRRHDHQCPADLRRYIMEADENIIVRFPLIPGGGRKAEDSVKTVRSSVQIPMTTDDGNPWKPGNYIFRMTAVRFCNEGIEYDTQIPDVHFSIAT